jgi:ribonuclease PH
MVRGAGFERGTEPHKTEGSQGLTHSETHELAAVVGAWSALPRSLRLSIMGIIRTHLETQKAASQAGSVPSITKRI